MKLTVSVLAAIPLAAAPGTTLPFDSGWHFMEGDAPGAAQTEFAGNAWRSVDVPHDWGIEGPFDEKAPARGAGAFLPAGVGWYRKHFVLPADAASRRVFAEFDGVTRRVSRRPPTTLGTKRTAAIVRTLYDDWTPPQRRGA